MIGDTPVIFKSTKLGVLGLGAVAFSMAALTFGSGTAGAGPNDPGMTDVRGNGVVSSRQADSTSGARHCVVDPGTLGTSSTVTADLGEPMQRAAEAGPSWVGSDGFRAVGVNPSNPWRSGGINRRGGYRTSPKTGPQCGTGSAQPGNRF